MALTKNAFALQRRILFPTRILCVFCWGTRNVLRSTRNALISPRIFHLRTEIPCFQIQLPAKLTRSFTRYILHLGGKENFLNKLRVASFLTGLSNKVRSPTYFERANISRQNTHGCLQVYDNTMTPHRMRHNIAKFSPPKTDKNCSMT